MFSCELSSFRICGFIRLQILQSSTVERNRDFLISENMLNNHHKSRRYEKLGVGGYYSKSITRDVKIIRGANGSRTRDHDGYVTWLDMHLLTSGQ